MHIEHKRWISTKTIKERLEVSRTASYEIAREIAMDSDEPDAVVKRARLLRVREDLFDRWVVKNGYKPHDQERASLLVPSYKGGPTGVAAGGAS